jgi:hypothetical protein
MPDLRQKLSTLLNRYDRDRERNLTEADVSANYIDHLFAALEWDILNPNEYNRQRYVREAGFADVGLLLHGDPRIFVEVKRFGLIPKSTERRGDRTPEEKQVFKYARQAKIKWAILTNFERLHVFDADQERLILAFDDPQEYLPRIEELDRLAKPHIERDSLEHFAQLQAKEDLDRGFLESLKRWRKLLAQDILDRNASNEVILTGSQPRSERGQPDLDKLRRVVQRILDRLVIIRFADDRELLDDFGVVEGMLGGFKTRRSYAAEGQLYRDFLGFCAGMDRKHNTEIFSPKHPSEKITVGNDCLAELFDEITGISFRKFSSDILGNTYESYLGHRLELRDGSVELAERRDLRKGAGIYYTPTYIVRYIVDNTLGRKLAELEAQHGLRMIRFHKQRAAVEQAFADALDNHPHEWKELGDTYWDRADYVPLIEKKTHGKPGDTGAATGLRCETDDKTIQVSAKVANTWKPVLDMTVADDKLRFFIFYGIRRFLRDNARKKKWGEGRLLELALEKIQVPVFLSHGVHHVEHHLKTLELVLAEMKKHSPLHNLTEMERAIAATDEEIDQLVYKLYGLTPAEIRLVEESTSKPGATKS